jgi:hypothetical protein
MSIKTSEPPPQEPSDSGRDDYADEQPDQQGKQECFHLGSFGFDGAALLLQPDAVT